VERVAALNARVEELEAALTDCGQVCTTGCPKYPFSCYIVCLHARMRAPGAHTSNVTMSA
jgi:hypothetical protein